MLVLCWLSAEYHVVDGNHQMIFVRSSYTVEVRHISCTSLAPPTLP